MIKLKDILKEKDGKPFTASFDKGINYLANRSDIFSLLSIRDQQIAEGEFYLDDYNVISPVDFKRAVFVLDIKSAVLNLSAVFLVTTSNYFRFRKELKKDLVALKSLPLISEEEQKEKIVKINETLLEHQIAYFLIDMNDPINKDHEVLINEVMNDHLNEAIYVLNQVSQIDTLSMNDQSLIENDQSILASSNSDPSKLKEKKLSDITKKQNKLKHLIKDVSISDDDEHSIVIGDDVKENQKEDVKIKRSDKENKNKKKKDKIKDKGKFDKAYFKAMLKRNVFSLVFAFIFAFALIFVIEMATSFLLGKEQRLGGGILLAVSLLGTTLDIYLAASLYSDSKKFMKTNADHWTSVISYTLMNLLGVLFGIGLYLLLAGLKVSLFQERIISYEVILVACSLGVILLLSSLLANYLSLIVEKIQDAIKKKK